MPRHDAYPGQTRFYATVGLMIGLMVGLFMYNFLAPDGGEQSLQGLRLLWLVMFGTVGGVVGRLLVVAQSEDVLAERPDPRSVEEPEPERNERFFTLQSGLYTAEQLRTMRVRSTTAPMSPPDAEVRLQVRDFDHSARVSVLEGVLEKLSAREAGARALNDAIARAPKVTGELRLRPVAFHSEGPVALDGRSPLGWSFHFVDGAIGLGCYATVTAQEISLQYHTAATYSHPETEDWPDPEDLLKWVEAEVTHSPDLSWYLKVNLPEDCMLYLRDPVRIADIDVPGQSVRNGDFLSMRIERDEAAERFSIAGLIAWFRGEELPETDDALAEALEDQAFCDGLRTLEPKTLIRTANALVRSVGLQAASDLAQACVDATSHAERTELLSILSRVPGSLPLALLQRLALELDDEESRLLAESLFEKRRGQELDVADDPMAGLSFSGCRTAMGKHATIVVPLRSTYDPNEDLLVPLTELGLRITRRRLLSGDANLLVGAHLRSNTDETEALVTSTPMPVPCHILHLVGAGASTLGQAVERRKLVYPRTEILADAGSGHPTRVHRAVLYMAALEIDEPDVVPQLIAGAARSRHDAALRRAVLSAMRAQSSPDALVWIRAIADDPEHEDAELAAEAATMWLARFAPPLEEEDVDD